MLSGHVWAAQTQLERDTANWKTEGRNQQDPAQGGAAVGARKQSQGWVYRHC